MILNLKQNKDILRHLNGEYKAYAKLFIKNVKSKCEMDSFSKESINQMLQLLHDGQNSNKRLSEVI